MSDMMAIPVSNYKYQPSKSFVDISSQSVGDGLLQHVGNIQKCKYQHQKLPIKLIPRDKDSDYSDTVQHTTYLHDQFAKDSVYSSKLLNKLAILQRVVDTLRSIYSEYK